MAIVPSYVSSCLLMMMMLLVTWRASTCAPTRAPAPGAERCQWRASLFRNLLDNIKGLLKSEDLCFGITSSRVVVSSKSDTLLTCIPAMAQQNCLVQRNSSFSETECMRSIMKDLGHYAAVFQSYLGAKLRSRDREVALLSPTVEMIKGLRKNCSLPEEEEKEEADVAQMWGSDTFNNRQEMCKMMRGFYTRTITINRAVGYICSGEHRK